MKVSRTQKNCPLILYMLWELASSFPEKLVSFFFPSLLTGCLMNSPDLLLVPEPALEAVCRQRFGIRRAMAMVWWCHSAQVGGEATKQTQLCPHLAWAACPYPVTGTMRVHQAVESLDGEMGFCGSERHPLRKSFSSKNAFFPAPLHSLCPFKPFILCNVLGAGDWKDKGAREIDGSWCLLTSLGNAIGDFFPFKSTISRVRGVVMC